MTDRTGRQAGPAGRSPALPPLRSLALALALAGCAGMPQLPGLSGAPSSASAPLAEAPSAPLDPLAAFVAGAAPGTERLVALPGGSARVRVQRAYAAASGRECREVLIGRGLEERASVLCRQDGGWVAARPLLGGGSPRP